MKYKVPLQSASTSQTLTVTALQFYVILYEAEIFIPLAGLKNVN